MDRTPVWSEDRLSNERHNPIVLVTNEVHGYRNVIVSRLFPTMTQLHAAIV